MGVVESNVVRLPGNHKSSSFLASPPPPSPPLSLRPKPRNACLNKLRAVHSSVLLCSKLWRITFLQICTFALFCALQCFRCALQWFRCALCTEGKVPNAESLQKKCAENGNGFEKWAQKAFDLRNGHRRWSLCTVNENELSAKCKMHFFCNRRRFNKVNNVDRVQISLDENFIWRWFHF